MKKAFNEQYSAELEKEIIKFLAEHFPDGYTRNHTIIVEIIKNN